MRKTQQFVFRIFTYVLGLFLCSVSVALSINSDLGISPVSSLPYAISLVLNQRGISNITLGTTSMMVYGLYVLLQILILRREFQWVQLLQIGTAVLHGYMMDFGRWVVGDFVLPGYGGRLVMLAIGIVLLALALYLYVSPNLLPLPPEGLNLAVAKKLGNMPYHVIKRILDCVFVASAALITLVGLGHVQGVREGTVILALCVGPVIGLWAKLLDPIFRPLWFGATDQEKAPLPADSKENA